MMTSLLLAALTFTPGNVEVVVEKSAQRKARTVQYAAEEMTNFLSRAFGSAVPIVHQIDPAKCAIVLGSNVWSVAAGIDTTALPRDGFKLKTAGNALYIAGLDENVDPLRTNNDEFQRATLFGVYEFLERFVGCRFYFPGELGEIVPQTATVSVPDLDETCAPVWTERHFSWRYGAWFDPAVKHEIEIKKERYRIRMQTRMLPSCHGQYLSKIVQRFGKTNPEYFYLNKQGVRVIRDTEVVPLYVNAQLCLTSDVWEEFYKDARSYFLGEKPEVRGVIRGKAPNYKFEWGRQTSSGMYYDIMPHDGMMKCHCANCQAAYAKAKDPNNYANEIVWHKTAELAQRLKDEGIAGNLTQMAYHPYANVPDFKLPDNVIVTVCNNGGWVQGERAEADFARVKAWSEKVGKVKLYNNTGKFSTCNTDIANVPSTTPFAVAAFYNRVSPYVRGAYFSGPADRFLYIAMNYYVYSRIAWKGQADVSAIMDEHYRLMYGAAAPEMKAFFEILEQKWMREIIGNVAETPLGTVHMVPSDFRIWTELYSEKALQPLVALLAKAEKAVVPGSLEARRLALVRQEFLDPMLTTARDYIKGLSVANEEARRVANPPKSVVVDFKPVTISVDKIVEGQPFKAVKFKADLKPNTWYRISYFVKGENVNPYAKRGGANAVAWTSEASDKGEVFPLVGLDGTFDWVHQSGEFRILKNVPADFKPEIDVRLFQATGTAHFRDLIVEQIAR